MDVMQHGKRNLAIDLKNPKGQQLVQRLVTQYDVIIEPFRPGVMEQLNLGPETLCSQNPKLIYARLTGFGQNGRLARRAGHDINYAAISGVLSMLGRHNEKPTPPINILADFAGGGLMCALGICIALLERQRSGRGQVIDAAMIDGAAYVASWLTMSTQIHPFWGKKRGQNMLDGGAYFYDTYETKDGRYMSVGALEPQFFQLFKDNLDLPELSQFVADDKEQEAAKTLVRLKFLEKTQDEWSQIFENIDACVYPVLELHEAEKHDHNQERKSFQEIDGIKVPRPAPRLSRTPGVVSEEPIDALEGAIEALKELQLTSKELEELVNEYVLTLPMEKGKL